MSALRHAMSHAVLGWVKPELDETLRKARGEIEAFADAPAEGGHMRLCAGYLHQVQGTLRMVELYAPAMVAEEMEQLAQALQDGAVAELNDACATLMRGTMLLPDYLERLQDGHRDIPIVLLPLLNEIRAARGAPGLNESALFAVDADAPAPTEAEIEHARGSLSGRNRALLDSVGGALKEELLRTKDALDLHLRTGGDIGALRPQLTALSSVADTLGMMGLGVARNVVQQQRDALWRMLDGADPVDEGALLDIAGALLYVDAMLDDQVAYLGAPSGEGEDDAKAAEVRRTVEVLAQEAIANFAQAREHFVAFIETGWDHARLDEVPALLGEVVGALRILDLPQAADYLEGVRRYIRNELIGKQRVPGGHQLDTLADAMASLEYFLEALRERRPNYGEILDIARSSLESLHYWPLPPEEQAASEPAVDADAAVADATIDAAQPEAIEPAWTQDETAATQGVATQAGDSSATALPASPFGEVDINALQFDESDFAATSPDETTPPSAEGLVVASSEAVDAGEAAETAPSEEIVIQATETTDANDADADEPAMDMSIALAAAPTAVIEGGFDESVDGIDSDIRDVFLEEFDEEIANLDQLLPSWKAAPENQERLRPVRRVFHTLKGSGRLVGAKTLGEFSWKIESMLNRVLDGTRPASPAVVAMIDQAVAVLPQLNAALHGQGRISADLPALEATAERIAAGEEVFYRNEAAPDATPATSATVVAEPVSEEIVAEAIPEAEGTPASVDSVLLEILEAEVGAHLETLNAWLAQARQQPQPANEPLLRALHTINGAFAMTDVPEITAVTGQAETYVQRLLAAEQPPVAEGISAIGDTADAIGTCIDALRGESPRIPSFAALATRLAPLVDSLPPAQWPPASQLVEDDAPESPLEDTVTTEALGTVDDVSHFIEGLPQGPGFATPERADAAAAAEPVFEAEAASSSVSEDAAPALLETSETPVSGLPEAASEFADADAAIEVETAAAAGETHAIAQELDEVPAVSGLALEEPLTTDSQPSSAVDDAHEEAALDAAEVVSGQLDSYLLRAETHVAVEAADAAPAATDEIEDVVTEAAGDGAGESGTDGVPATAGPAALAQEAIGAPVDDATDAEAAIAADSGVDGDRIGETAIDDTPDLEAVEAVEAEAAVDETLPGALAEAPGEATTVDALLDARAETVVLGDAGAVAADPERVDVADTVAPAVALPPLSVPVEVDDGHEPLDQTGLDMELVEIFAEEGRDLLDHCDSLISELRQAPEDRELLSGLQRDLHTLKGGARMAGINAIGDLGHAIESLLESVASHRTAFAPDDVRLLERGFDHLHYLLTRVDARRAIQHPDALIEAFDARAAGRLEAPVDAPVAPAPASATEAPATIAVPVPAPLSAPLPDEAFEEEVAARAPQEQVRVRAELLDQLVNHAGEVAIYRSRLEQQMGAFRSAMGELDRTNARLRDQLRRLDLETEAQIVARYQREQDSGDQTFDPLELDRFSTLQQLSRALNESAADLTGLQGVLDDLSRQYDGLLQQQSRVSSELQDGLMSARMVPFDGVVPRLRRAVRQAAGETGKQVQLRLDGTHGELDRNVLDHMVAPIEHMLRNSIAHGLETPAARRAAGKPEEGVIQLRMRREGSEIVLQVSDDGAGLNRAAIRRRAEQRGLVQPGAVLSEAELDALIMETGFSTADTVSQLAGRGVGMDVVRNEVLQLGGSVEIASVDGQGVTFTLRLPQTLAVTQAVFVQIGETHFAVPVASVNGIGRIARERYESGTGAYHYNGEDYTLYDLGLLVGQEAARAEGQAQVPLLLVRAGELRAAVAIDQVLGNREIVVKSVGPQIASVPGIYGATITGDGEVVVILDVAPLVRRHLAQPERPHAVVAPIEARHVPLVMVVDDSLTMRKVTGRVLERHNLEVVTARDGVEALERLEERVPDLMLLDIEMPRMDGYELATAMRADARFKDVPIVMITSRTGDKHRQRAIEIGVQRYMGKPYQELDLMRNVYDLLGIARARQ